MQPRIEILFEKYFVGKRITMSFAANKTIELWRSFMPYRHNIKNGIGTEMYSMEVFPRAFFDAFDPNAVFEKWAALEVANQQAIPENMELLHCPAGMYAVFNHKGPATEGERTYQYIFQIWLPQSEYFLDQRPHFAVMGEKYKQNDPESEEEIWIPVRTI